RVVDLQGPGRIRADQLGVAEEAVPGLAEAGRVHAVDGTGLQQVLGAVLPPRPVGLVVVDAQRPAVPVLLTAGLLAVARLAGAPRTGGVAVPGRAGTAVPPHEAVERGDGQRAVGAASQRRRHTVQVLVGEEGAGALDQ